VVGQALGQGLVIGPASGSLHLQVEPLETALHVSSGHPTERFGFPVASVMAGHGEVGEGAVGPLDEVGEDAASEIARRYTLAGIAARLGQTGLAVKGGGGHPVARHTKDTTPGMCDLNIFQDGNQSISMRRIMQSVAESIVSA
jgi:hypothetical protein